MAFSCQSCATLCKEVRKWLVLRSFKCFHLHASFPPARVRRNLQGKEIKTPRAWENPTARLRQVHLWYWGVQSSSPKCQKYLQNFFLALLSIFPAQGGWGIWLQTSLGNRRAGSKAITFALGSLKASKGDEKGHVCEVKNTIKDSSSLNPCSWNGGLGQTAKCCRENNPPAFVWFF